MKKVTSYIVYGLGAAAILGAGLIGGAVYTKYTNQPKTAYITDLNGDNKPDLVLKNRHGKNIEFLLAPKDDKGPYKSLDMIEEEQLEEFKKKQGERRNLIEGRFSNIK